MRRRAWTEANPSAHEAAASRTPPCIYSHVSTYRALQLELQLYSPSLRVDNRGPIAVFNNNDQISGKLVLDCLAHHTGKLTLTVEGALIHPSKPGLPHSEARRHVFFTHSHCIPVSSEEINRFTFRDTFKRRRPSATLLSIKSGLIERSYPFQFSLPQGSRPGQELPPTFISQGLHRSPLATTSEISYKLIATWEPEGSDQPSYLEIPLIVQLDEDFQSEDALEGTGSPWLEIPLMTERPMPVRLAAALPPTATFSRKSSIPFYVVFATNPRSSSFAKEIASDSTIYVALTRQIVINEPQTMLMLTPPSSPSDEEMGSGDLSPRKLLRRVAKSSPRLNRKRKMDDFMLSDKPLPDIPSKSCFSESKTLFSDLFIGFPKRPRRRCVDGKHPSLEDQSSLPDGLFKFQIPLDSDMLPCIDWAGVSVKYYLDISVSIDQDDWRARMPVRIF